MSDVFKVFLHRRAVAVRPFFWTLIRDGLYNFLSADIVYLHPVHQTPMSEVSC
jgi:hypothetical protein